MQRRCFFERMMLAAVGLVWMFQMPAQAEEVPKEERIIPGVYAEDLALGGMTVREAEACLASRLKEMTQVPLVVRFAETEGGDQTATVILGELGIRWANPEVLVGVEALGNRGTLIHQYKEQKDIERKNRVLDLQYALDPELVSRYFREQAAMVDREVQEAAIQRIDGQFLVTEGKPGLTLDVEASAQELLARSVHWDSPEEQSFEATVLEVQPRCTYEELSRIRDPLGTATTYYNSSANSGRNQNLVTGIGLINGTVVLPGEVFSANGAMAPYTEERGWGYGGSYTAEGKIEQTLGGGICQISSTLYNAALQAELTITQRNNHSMTVSYLPVGLDAAIAGDWKDLKFRNDYEAPIYLECYAKNGTLYFAVWGQETRPENRQVSYYSEVTKTWEEEPVYEDDPTLPIGQEEVSYGGAIGHTSVTYKEVRVDGQVVEKTVVSEDYYRASAKVIRRGTNPEPAAAG